MPNEWMLVTQFCWFQVAVINHSGKILPGKILSVQQMLRVRVLHLQDRAEYISTSREEYTLMTLFMKMITMTQPTSKVKAAEVKALYLQTSMTLRGLNLTTARVGAIKTRVSLNLWGWTVAAQNVDFIQNFSTNYDKPASVAIIMLIVEKSTIRKKQELHMYKTVNTKTRFTTGAQTAWTRCRDQRLCWSPSMFGFSILTFHLTSTALIWLI